MAAINCISCKQSVEIGITQDEYVEFVESGKFVQDYFPQMPADLREMLISGICGKCWDKLFNAGKGELYE